MPRKPTHDSHPGTPYYYPTQGDFSEIEELKKHFAEIVHTHDIPTLTGSLLASQLPTGQPTWAANVRFSNTLHVTGAANAHASAQGLELLGGGSAYGRVQAYDRVGAAYITLDFRGNPITFHEGGTEQMRLTDRLLVGTSTNGNSGAGGVHVAGVSQFDERVIVGLQSSGGGNSLDFYRNLTGATAVGGLLRVNAGGTLKWLIQFRRDTVEFGVPITIGTSALGNTAAGGIRATGRSQFDGRVDMNDPRKTSRRALKKDIEALKGSLDRVMALRPVSFTWRADHRPSLGFVADEVASVDPRYGDEDSWSADVVLADLVSVVQGLVNRLEAHV